MKSRIFIVCSLLLLASLGFQKNFTLAAGDGFNLSQATIVNSPSDVAGWPATANITNIDLSGTEAGPGTIKVDFDKRTGANAWPNTTSPGFGALQYTLWAFLNVNGQWVGSGVIQFWQGRELTAASSIDQMPCSWFYDSRWGALSGHQIHTGDQIGFMVTQGNARGRTDSTGDLRERSNVVLATAPINSVNPSTCSNAPSNTSNPTNTNNPTESPVPSNETTITQIDPLIVAPNNNIVITGTNLTDKAQIESYTGAVFKPTGTLNTDKTQLTIKIPLAAVDGEYAVAIITSGDLVYSPNNINVRKGAKPVTTGTTLPVPSSGLPTDLGQLISTIFIWSLSIIGLVIFVRFFYAGFLWFTAAGNTDRTSRAKTIMKNAVYGALVLFSAYLILNTINPDLVGGKFTMPGLSGSTPANTDTGPTCEDVPDALACMSTDNTNAVQQIRDYVIRTMPTVDLTTNCGLFEITKRVAWVLKDYGVGLLKTFHSSQCNGYSSDVVAYQDNSGVDIFGDATGKNTPQWVPMPPSTESGVEYAPAIDPGDGGSY